MGRVPNYSKDRSKLGGWAAQEKRVINNENVIIKDGKGRYPQCFKIIPYGWCPKTEEINEEAENVPKTCKNCQEFLKSKFYQKHFLPDEHKKRLERLKKIGLSPMIVNVRKRD